TILLFYRLPFLVIHATKPCLCVIESKLNLRNRCKTAALENQVQVNATLRIELEVLKGAAEALLRTVELHQGNIEILAESMRCHRSDGNGA
ncbi:MAG: hypothetical protein C4287_19855, partial [Leptolyngbya sp. ERB_1_2]